MAAAREATPQVLHLTHHGREINAAVLLLHTDCRQQAMSGEAVSQHPVDTSGND